MMPALIFGLCLFPVAWRRGTVTELPHEQLPHTSRTGDHHHGYKRRRLDTASFGTIEFIEQRIDDIR